MIAGLLLGLRVGALCVIAVALLFALALVMVDLFMDHR